MSLRNLYSVFFLPLLLVVLVVGPPLWLDFAAPEADAVVTTKYEGYRLNREPDGGWRRRLVVFTKVRTPAGATHTGEMMLGVADYDRLSVGSHVRVRYLPFYPYSTRPVARTSLVQARELLTPENTRGKWFAMLLIFGPLILVAGRFSRVASIVVAFAWLGATWVYIMRPPPPPTPGSQHTSARVDWTEVRSRGLGRNRRSRLAIPYRYVALRFLPPGARDSITVLDAVDSASLVPAPEKGTLEPIGYQPGAPRTALLLVGKRTFIAGNRFDYVVLAFAPILLGLVFGTAWRMRSRRAPRPAIARTRSARPNDG